MQNKSKEQIPDVGRIWRLDAGPFILHNTHLARKSEYDAGCPICSGRLGQSPGLVATKVAEPVLGESGGTDETGSTASSRRDELVEALFGNSGEL